MNRRMVLALLAALVSTPALATGGIYCNGADGAKVSAFLTVGRVPGLAVVGARIDIPGKAWSMIAADDADRIVLAQGAVIGDLTVADFSDPGAEQIQVSLRVLQARVQETSAAAGTLAVPGEGAWPLICEIE